MNLSIPYGTCARPVVLPEDVSVDTIQYRDQPIPDADVCVRQALAAPAGSKPLAELARDRTSAVILISDLSRLCPSYLFLEALLDELNAGGLPDERIDIVVSLGMHRKQTEAELQQLVGSQVWLRVRVHNHSALPEDCILLGTTSLGTPVEINRRVVEADLLIATGNIEPHRLVGISGGVKALVPGVASQRCIEHNHSLSQQFRASAGDPENPVHRDLLEATRFIPIHFLFNTIVNHRRELIGAVAGGVEEAHCIGSKLARNHFIVTMSRKYDLVLASAGGHPKDMQLYQAVKSMANAAKLLKPGGTLLIAARCEEMYGNGLFQYWAETIQDRSRIVAMLKQKFVLGPHKFEHLDELLRHCAVHLYSELPPSTAELLGLVPVGDLQTEINRLALPGQTIAYMPYASLTFVEGEPEVDAYEESNS
jgi:nickel-dependent lactate racemase